MKTLNEVIKALEICSTHLRCMDGCPYYRNECPLYEMEKDALHYLREYQHWQDIMEEVPSYYEFVKMQNSWKEQQGNPPLTWETLKTMEGKPVWFEWTGSPMWGIVDGIYTNAYGVENLVICIPHDYLHFDKRMQGQVWQAYRKETE